MLAYQRLSFVAMKGRGLSLSWRSLLWCIILGGALTLHVGSYGSSDPSSLTHPATEAPSNTIPPPGVSRESEKADLEDLRRLDLILSHAIATTTAGSEAHAGKKHTKKWIRKIKAQAPIIAFLIGAILLGLTTPEGAVRVPIGSTALPGAPKMAATEPLITSRGSPEKEKKKEDSKTGDER